MRLTWDALCIEVTASDGGPTGPPPFAASCLRLVGIQLSHHLDTSLIHTGVLPLRGLERLPKRGQVTDALRDQIGRLPGGLEQLLGLFDPGRLDGRPGDWKQRLEVRSDRPDSATRRGRLV